MRRLRVAFSAAALAVALSMVATPASPRALPIGSLHPCALLSPAELGRVFKLHFTQGVQKSPVGATECEYAGHNAARTAGAAFFLELYPRVPANAQLTPPAAVHRRRVAFPVPAAFYVILPPGTQGDWLYYRWHRGMVRLHIGGNRLTPYNCANCNADANMRRLTVLARLVYSRLR